MARLTRKRMAECRVLLQEICVIAFGIACLMLGGSANACPDADCADPHGDASRISDRNSDCGIHNMMVVGQKATFLSHLPMFRSEHRFQLILEATFRKDGKSLDDIYANDRKNHPETQMYTVSPADRFVLSRLFSPETQPPQRNAFPGTVFRGHLERGGKPINGFTDVGVYITRVVYARELQPDDTKSDKLEYILFGKAGELFLAHLITHEPDFDQIIAVTADGHNFTEAELNRGVTVTIANRENAAANRLKTKETVAAEAHVPGAHQFLPLQIHMGTEYYFEEGELFVPAKFGQTPLEKEAGF